LTSFLLACAGLVLLSGIFYLFPVMTTKSRAEDSDEANLEWYRLRQAELEEQGDDGLKRDIQLRLLEDNVKPDSPLGLSASAQGFPQWLLLPFVAVLSGALYYQLGAAPDVLINKQLDSLDEQSTPEQMQTLFAAIERRSAQRPANLHYTALLGRFYMGQQNYAQAAQLYGALAQEAPGDAEALAYAAQSEYLAGGRALSDRARMYAEQALAVDPHQRTALGLLGMASFEQGQYRAAIEYWQRLLAMESPDSETAQMIAGVIARAQDKMTAEGSAPPETAPGTAPGTAPETAPAPEVTAGVTVRVSLPEGVKLAGSDTVFVLARATDAQSRMPVAVQRLSASQLPATIRLDDSKSMAGQKLSELNSIAVVVQVSPSGQPGEASATWLGKVGPLAPSLNTDATEVLLSPKGS
jgi:cytochrome c-type biogenesis protein CcmH